MSAVIKPVKKFSREQPCTKIDLYNCFSGEHGYIPRAVVEAQGEIGTNSAKHMLSKGYVVYRTEKGIDLYELTAAGEAWLTAGVAAHLKRHPDDSAKLAVRTGTLAPRRIMRRVLRTPPAA